MSTVRIDMANPGPYRCLLPCLPGVSLRLIENSTLSEQMSIFSVGASNACGQAAARASGHVANGIAENEGEDWR